MKAHIAGPCVTDILNTVSRTLQAKTIHDTCPTDAGIVFTSSDGRATVGLKGGSSYMLTGHDLDSPAIYYKSHIKLVDVAESQNFGFNKFVI